MTITESNGTFTFAATDTTYTFNGAISTIKEYNWSKISQPLSSQAEKIKEGQL